MSAAALLGIAACSALLGDPTGAMAAQQPTWIRTWDGARAGVTAAPRDRAYRIVEDASGGFFVLGGSLSNANTPVPPPPPPLPGRFQSHDDLAVVRLSPEGSVVWSLTYDFPTIGDTDLTPQTQSGNDLPMDGVLGPDGSLFVLAQMTHRYDTVTINIGNPPQPTETTVAASGLGIVRISPTGSVVWNSIYVAPGARSMAPISMALSDSGRLYAAYVAITEQGGQSQGVLVVDSLNGATISDLTVNAAGASAFTLPRVVRRGPGGLIYVASTPPASTFSSALLTVIDDATVSIIRETFAFGAFSRGGVTGMVVSPISGEVVISASVDGAGGGDALVAKFTPSGDLAWTSQFDDPTNSSQNPTAGVALDAAGNVYTAGVQGITPSPSDVFIVRFAGADGAQDWSRIWSSGNNTWDYVTSRQGIAVGASKVVVSGWSHRGGSDHDMFALPLNADTGDLNAAIFYNAQLSDASDDRVSAGVLISADGGVVLAGHASSPQNMDLIVVKLAGETGSCGIADVANTDGDPTPDGVIDNGDFSSFFAAFFTNNLLADVANTDGDPTPDGVIDNGDFSAFFAAFFEGCPAD
jgi:hypothetical protein